MKKTAFAILFVLSCAVCSVSGHAEEGRQDVYSDILDKYYYALAEGWNPAVVSTQDLPEFMYDLTAEGPDSLGYQLLDLDGDGSQELIIGECYSYMEVNSEIRMVYRISDQGAEPLEMPDGIDYMNYLGDGKMAGSEDMEVPPYASVTNTYQIRNVDGVTKFEFQDGVYEISGQYYRNITAESGDTENDEELSEEAYYQATDAYSDSRQDVGYIRFSSYTPSSSAYSEEMKSYRMPETVELDGKTYTFPFSFDELLNDGWTIDPLSEDSWEQDGIQYYETIYPITGTCTKNGWSIDYACAKTDDSVSDTDLTENYYVQSISVLEGFDPDSDSENPCPLSVLNGIRLGDGIEGLEEYLKSEGYWFNSRMDAYILTITVYYDSYRNNYLELMVDAVRGTVYYIEYHCGKES